MQLAQGGTAVITALATLLGAALPVTAAGGSSVDPGLLVLKASDVPAGFRVDGHASRSWSNAAFVGAEPKLRRLVVESGRITGYLATYENRVAAQAGTILSLSHLCGRAAGAHVLFSARCPATRTASE